MILCPLLVIYYWIALSFFNGSLLATTAIMWEMGPLAFFRWFAPRPDWRVSFSYGGWLACQAAMYRFLSSKISMGQLTPAGNLLEYRTNGLSAWLATHVVFAVCVLYGPVDPAIIAKNWEALLVAANVYGFLLSGVAYIKAHLCPTYEGDCKFSGKLGRAFSYRRDARKNMSNSEAGSWFYDFYMGIELNPRFGRSFDFKLFHNGRPGIIAWTLV
jgi:7-dehydrocholesterol reductase